MKKTRGLYHVSERRYFNFSPGPFSEIVAVLTAPAVEQDSKNRATRTEQADRTDRTGLPAQQSQERTFRAGQPGQDS